MKRITDKLRSYLESQGITQQDIANRFGISKQSINQLMTGSKPFGKKVAQRWADEFGLSASWLLTGEGEMLKESSAKVDNSSPCFDAATIQGGAAHGTGMEQLMRGMEVGRMLAPGLTTGNDIPYIQVMGNSMVNRKDPAHSIPEGAWVGVKPSTLSTIMWGEVYAIMTTDGPIIKKLMPSEHEGYITCVSYNEEDGYLPFDLACTDIIPPLYNIIGIVAVKRWK